MYILNDYVVKNTSKTILVNLPNYNFIRTRFYKSPN